MRQVKIAKLYYQRAKGAYGDGCPERLHKNLWKCREARQKWDAQTASAKNKLAQYEPDIRQMAAIATQADLQSSLFLLVPPLPALTGEKACDRALAVIDIGAAILFGEAQRSRDAVMVGEQMEGYEIARDQYETTLRYFASAKEEFGRADRPASGFWELNELKRRAQLAVIILSGDTSNVEEAIRATAQRAQRECERFSEASKLLTPSAKTVQAICATLTGT